jgi:radical SAM protein with 4Fe4S-binding SPASM domain
MVAQLDSQFRDQFFQGMPAIWDGSRYLVWDGRNFRILVYENLPETTIVPPVSKDFSVSQPVLERAPNWLSAVLVLTNRCNLGCTYCYAEANEHVETNGTDGMTTDQVKNILASCLQRGIDRLYVSFIGGEPTLKRDCLQTAVEFLEESSSSYSLHIITNGTSAQLFQDWLIDKRFDFTVSSDGLPGDHDAQRPTLGGQGSSNRVERFISRLVERRALFQVRATITERNVANLPRAIEYWASLGVRFVHFELVDIFGRARFLNGTPDLGRYIDVLSDVIDTAQRLGVYLVNSAFMKLLVPSTAFCTSTRGQRLHFNPDSSVSACYKIQRKAGSPENFVIGDVTRQGMNLDENKRQDLKAFGASYFVECQSCFARTVCGGGCPLHQQLHAPPGHVDQRLCDVKRGILRHAIMQIYECSRKREASILFGSSLYDALVEKKFEPQNSNNRVLWKQSGQTVLE